MIRQLTRKEVITFIREHETEDPADLMLRTHSWPDLPMTLIAEQIATRQKAVSKLPQWYAKDGIIFPPRLNLSQASDERVARYRAEYTQAKSILDLTAGTGVDLYYMSRKALRCIAVEPDAELAKLLDHNMELLGREVSVHTITAEEFLSTWDEKVDLIFIDPSRRDEADKRVYQLKDSRPSVPDLLPQIMNHTDHLIIKASPMLHIVDTLRLLKEVSLVEVISLQNEVKEVCIHIRSKYEGPVMMKATDLRSDQSIRTFEFTQDEERQAVVKTGSLDTYLYDPMASLRKAGAFRVTAERFGIKKLDTNTHLYTASDLKVDFPGRIFRILDTFAPTKREIQKRMPDGIVNLLVRNFPMPANQIKKKYRLKDGGDQMLVMTQTQSEGRIAILCETV